MKCAHCGRTIEQGMYERTWLALIPGPSELARDMPHFHSKRKECREEAFRRAAGKGALT